jgi:hypothetical protein
MERVYDALLTLEPHIVSSAEMHHTLLPVLGAPGPDGRTPIVADDVKRNAAILRPVLMSLDGRQPSSLQYQTAMHKFDAAFIDSPKPTSKRYMLVF